MVRIAGSAIVAAVLGATTAFASAPLFEVVTYHPVGANPWSMVAADFDQDGSLDLATSNASLNTVSILMNDGQGVFSLDSSYSVGLFPSCISTGDFNGDGYPDLALTNNGTGNVSVFMNNKDGTLGAKVDYGAMNSPFCVTSADFDHDGKFDLAIGQGEGVTILHNSGEGAFASPVTYQLGWGGEPSSIIAADFNGDGTPDLAVTRFGSQPDMASNVSILMNKGDGTFARSVSYGSWLDPTFVCSADFDKDGKLDIAVTHVSGFSTLKNNGNGTFAERIFYRIEPWPWSIVAADFDLDGSVDLAVPCGQSVALSVFSGSGNGTFASAGNYGSVCPSSLCTGDFDGDGRLDLAAGSEGAISMFFNRSQSTEVGEDGLRTQPETYVLAQNFPNPFNPITTVAFSLPQAAHITIDVFDVLGNRVKRLASERFIAGRHSVLWNGRNESGQLTSSGVYFYRLSTAGYDTTRKMLLLK